MCDQFSETVASGIEIWPTASGQKYVDASNLPYIFHINIQLKKIYHEINSCPILTIFVSTKAECIVVLNLLCNFNIIL